MRASLQRTGAMMARIPPSDDGEAYSVKKTSEVVPFLKLLPLHNEVSESAKLSALRDQLLERRRSIILSAAASNTIPSHSAIRQIAEIQIAIAAIESVADENISY